MEKTADGKAAVHYLEIFKSSKVGIIMVQKSVVLWKMEHVGKNKKISVVYRSSL